MHYFQLESYQFPGYFRTLKRNWKHSLLPGVCAAAGVLVLIAAALFLLISASLLWQVIGGAVLLAELLCAKGYI